MLAQPGYQEGMPAESTLTPNLGDHGLARYWEPMPEEEGCRAT